MKYYNQVIQYHLITLMLLDYDDFQDMLNSPVRLFLFLLDRYGLDITIEGQTKKLFYLKKYDRKIEWEWISKPKAGHLSWQAIETTENGERESSVNFLYGMDDEAYLKDYKNLDI
jgi:hypothetical protein